MSYATLRRFLRLIAVAVSMLFGLSSYAQGHQNYALLVGVSTYPNLEKDLQPPLARQNPPSLAR